MTIITIGGMRKVFMDVLQHNIKILREREGMTQQELAEYLHLSHHAVSAWERGKNLPPLPETVKMARLFKVSIDDFVSTKFTTE